MILGIPKILIIAIWLKSAVSSNYTLSVIHFNDFHARYEPITNLSTTCEGENCIGGFSRLSWKIRDLIKNKPNSLLLNAGDNFQGTLWYIVHKWNVTQHFLNKLPFDAITLGNHEFDDGIAGVVPFLKSLQAPVVVSNIDDSKEPTFQNLYNKSVIVEKNGKKIGIIGVLTTTTSSVSHTGNLILEDESASVNAEAEKLEKQGVFSIIVLSHCGYEADLEIAKNSTSAKISLIVGGHTDTFLYTGTPVPGPDKPSGPYPTIVSNKEGKNILVVQASAYTKYLGELTLVFDDSGTVSEYYGNPIFLDQNIPTDPEIDADLQIWKQAVDLEGNKTVGETIYEMPNAPCRSAECRLGNFVTDAMVSSYIDKADDDSWTYASIAMIHAGGMRAGIDKGFITFNNLATTFPFQDTIDVFDIEGKHIKEILESSMDDKHLQYPHLFQVSGILVIFNITKPEGERIQSLKIRSTKKCTTPVYEDLIPEQDYRLILPTFLSSSGFNPLFKKYLRNKRLGDLDLDVYVNYLGKNSPLHQEIEDRIQIKT